MKNTFINIAKNIYGVCITYAVLIGAVVSAIYIVGFIIGGGTGESMAIAGAKIMKSAIRYDIVLP